VILIGDAGGPVIVRASRQSKRVLVAIRGAEEGTTHHAWLTPDEAVSLAGSLMCAVIETGAELDEADTGAQP
jgi:hypothetical protein